MAKNRRKRLEWLKFFPMDFWHGTEEMTNEEVGAYIRLLCKAWMNSVNGNVPPHVPFRASAILAAMPGTSKREWERIRKVVLEKFENGSLDLKGESTKVLLNHRLSEEQEEALQDSKDQRERALKRDYGKAPAVPGHSPGNAAVVPKEERTEQTEEITEQRSHLVGEELMKAKALHKALAQIWQQEKGTAGAICPYPGKTRESFEDLARTVDHEVIKDAFRLWAKDAGDPDRNPSPIGGFMKSAAEYLLLARPATAPPAPAVDPELKKRQEESILRLAKESIKQFENAPKRNEESADDFMNRE